MFFGFFCVVGVFLCIVLSLRGLGMIFFGDFLLVVLGVGREALCEMLVKVEVRVFFIFRWVIVV